MLASSELETRWGYNASSLAAVPKLGSLSQETSLDRDMSYHPTENLIQGWYFDPDTVEFSLFAV